MSIEQLIQNIRSAEESTRTQATLDAAKAGPAAIPPLTAGMGDSRPEVARAAKRGLWNLVYAAGAPGSQHRKAAGQALAAQLEAGHPTEVRRELLWMVSEICETSQALRPAAALLDDAGLREDARMVLERLPGKEAVAALQAGFVRADRDFRYALAQSLRNRGVAVEGFPNQKLLPVRVR